MKKLLILLLPMLLSCTGAQIDLHGWSVAINVTLHGADTALPTLRAAIDSSTRLTPQQRETADNLLSVIHTTDIPRAEHDVSVLSTASGLTAQCAAHAAVDLLAGDATAVIATLDAVGDTVPPEVVFAITGVATAADMLLPNCVGTAVPVGTPTATARLRMHVHSSGGAR
jgi:hypothetical protein